ncbi:MAG: hypothetical protein PHH54_00825 [Candidatus Nanoarchaeia archaeon]|nr:hypothetical protein [Candidatus Nanoarchaeia archaeon]MDD5740506.1 hypothetical protein [Candidatus Nanoarchaeia archaeon]
MAYEFNKCEEGRLYKIVDGLMNLRKSIVGPKREYEESLENLALSSCEKIGNLVLKIGNSYIGKVIRKRAIPIYLTCCFGGALANTLANYNNTGNLGESVMLGTVIVASIAPAPFIAKAIVKGEENNK